MSRWQTRDPQALPGKPVERLFVAVPLGEGMLEKVQAFQSLLPAVEGLRLMKPDQLHVTLAFIGAVGIAKREAAQAVVEGLPEAGGGVLPSKGFLFIPSPARARVVAIELDDREGVLSSLYGILMDRLEAAHVMQREKRPFRAHLTIARLGRPGPVQPKSECAPLEYPVQSVCLFKSELKREGAQYSVLTCRVLGLAHAGLSEV